MSTLNLGPANNFYGDGINSSAGENTVRHYYDRVGIRAATAKNVYGQFASRKEMPKNSGKEFKISKFLNGYDRKLSDADFAKYGYMTGRSLADYQATLASAVALTEGAGAVNKRKLEKITVSTKLARYGEMLEYTDEVDMFSEDVMQTRYHEFMGNLANERNESLIQMDMLATPTVMFTGGATARTQIGQDAGATGTFDSKYKVSWDLIRQATRRLVANRAKKNTEIVTGTVKIDTRTVAPAYYAIIGADVKADLENVVRGTVAANGKTDNVWIPSHQYASGTTLAEGEVGLIHEVRFIEAESAFAYRGNGAAVPAGYTGTLSYTTFANNADAVVARGAGATAGSYFDVFPILFPTQDAFATVGLKGVGKITFNSKPPSDVSIINPYGTQGFFSYNFFYAGIILEPEKLLKLEVGASR